MEFFTPGFSISWGLRGVANVPLVVLPDVLEYRFFTGLSNIFS
jgi:hypothetical protein